MLDGDVALGDVRWKPRLRILDGDTRQPCVGWKCWTEMLGGDVGQGDDVGQGLHMVMLGENDGWGQV